MSAITNLFSGKGDDLAKRQQAEAAKSERRSLATAAKQQGELDQANSSGGRRKGRRLLTFLSGSGSNKLGAA